MDIPVLAGNVFRSKPNLMKRKKIRLWIYDKREIAIFKILSRLLILKINFYVLFRVCSKCSNYSSCYHNVKTLLEGIYKNAHSKMNMCFISERLLCCRPKAVLLWWLDKLMLLLHCCLPAKHCKTWSTLPSQNSVHPSEWCSFQHSQLHAAFLLSSPVEALTTCTSVSQTCA